MLATLGPAPAGPGYSWEMKWDGVRCLAAIDHDAVRLSGRSGRDITGTYPELAELGSLLTGRSAIVDGEIVALAGGVPDFGLLQQRMGRDRPPATLVERVPVALFVFDLLELDGSSTIDLPYLERRNLLADLGLRSRRIVVPPSWPDTTAEVMLAAAREHHLEGVVAKRSDSRYQPGRRSPDWRKIVLRTTTEVIIGGWQPGQGHRSRLGSLLVGAHDPAGALTYLGRVGTGFTDHTVRRLTGLLAELVTDTNPFGDTVPRAQARHARWVDPVLVGDVEYRALTKDRRLRAPSWRGLRDDRLATEVLLPPEET